MFLTNCGRHALETLSYLISRAATALSTHAESNCKHNCLGRKVRRRREKNEIHELKWSFLMLKKWKVRQKRLKKRAEGSKNRISIRVLPYGSLDKKSKIHKGTTFGKNHVPNTINPPFAVNNPLVFLLFLTRGGFMARNSTDTILSPSASSYRIRSVVVQKH